MHKHWWDNPKHRKLKKVAYELRTDCIVGTFENGVILKMPKAALLSRADIHIRLDEEKYGFVVSVKKFDVCGDMFLWFNYPEYREEAQKVAGGKDT